MGGTLFFFSFLFFIFCASPLANPTLFEDTLELVSTHQLAPERTSSVLHSLFRFPHHKGEKLLWVAINILLVWRKQHEHCEASYSILASAHETMRMRNKKREIKQKHDEIKFSHFSIFLCQNSLSNHSCLPCD